MPPLSLLTQSHTHLHSLNPSLSSLIPTTHITLPLKDAPIIPTPLIIYPFAQFKPQSQSLDPDFHHLPFEGCPCYPYSPIHIPILTPQYTQGLSFGLNLSSVIGFPSPPNMHGPGLIKVTLGESSPVGAPVIPHRHGTISTSAS